MLFSFVLCFFVLNYLANRPCLYCSLLLVLLFASSCAWADACFLDLTNDWFGSPPSRATCANVTTAHEAANSASFLAEMVSSTAAALADSAAGRMKEVVSSSHPKFAGGSLMVEWLKNFSTKGVRIPCVDVVLRL